MALKLFGVDFEQILTLIHKVTPAGGGTEKTESPRMKNELGKTSAPNVVEQVVQFRERKFTIKEYPANIGIGNGINESGKIKKKSEFFLPLYRILTLAFVFLHGATRYFPLEKPIFIFGKFFDVFEFPINPNQP